MAARLRDVMEELMMLEQTIRQARLQDAKAHARQELVFVDECPLNWSGVADPNAVVAEDPALQFNIVNSEGQVCVPDKYITEAPRKTARQLLRTSRRNITKMSEEMIAALLAQDDANLMF